MIPSFSRWAALGLALVRFPLWDNRRSRDNLRLSFARGRWPFYLLDTSPFVFTCDFDLRLLFLFACKAFFFYRAGHQSG